MIYPNRITLDSVVDINLHLKLRSGNAIHTDGCQASRVNMWWELHEFERMGLVLEYFLRTLKRRIY